MFAFIALTDLGMEHQKAADGLEVCSSSRNFAVCCFLMLLTGGLLNATTVLQPQFLQQTLGYTATIAGFPVGWRIWC